MNTDDLVRLLRQVPECHLRLIELARNIEGEDGGVDPAKIAFYAKELVEALKEAEGYCKETREVVQCLREMVRS